MRVYTAFILIAALGLIGCGGAEIKAAVRSDIDRQFRARQPAFALCYKTALERDKTLRGVVTLGFQLAPDAKVPGQVQLVSSAIADPAFTGCVVAGAQGIRLVEAHPRPLTVRYPLSFEPI